MKNFTKAIGAVLAAIPMTAGCETRPYDAVPLFPAQGMVMSEGKPAVGAVVLLTPDVPRKDGLTPVGRAGEDGKFWLTTYENNDGAPPGRYRVTINWPERKAGGGPPADRLKGRYADVSKSRWSVEIKEAPNTLPTLELEVPAETKSTKTKPAARRSLDPRERRQSK